MSDDPNELIYVTHPDLDDGAYVPRSAMRQLSSQNWVETDPPESTRSVPPAGELDPAEMVTIHHADLDRDAEVPRGALAQWRLSGWEQVGMPVDEHEPQPVVRDGDYDPNAHGLRGDDGVLAYLKTADDAERARVIAVERTGQNRSSITQWEQPTDDTAKDES